MTGPILIGMTGILTMLLRFANNERKRKIRESKHVPRNHWAR